jgi:two-component sensor histidine kinase
VRLLLGSTLAYAPFLTFFPAVIVATFIGGRGPGLLATICSAVLAWLIVQESFSEIASVDRTVAFGLYVLIASFNCVLIDWLLKAGEQNAALAARSETLLLELQHRVKNHIQIVASLLNLQARRAGPQAGAALTEAARRINTLSAAYSHLYQPDMRMDFGQHLHDIADAALGPARTERIIDVSAEPIMWGMDYVMPISLIASELMENALRHGLADQDGRVEVGLHKNGDRYVLRVTDTGGRLPEPFDPIRQAGLGLQLVNAMARRVQGTLRTERGPGTTSFLLEFPAPP